MRELDRCLQLTRKIKEKEELIIELKAKTIYPKSQILSDMPKGSGAENEIESYLIKLERLETCVSDLKNKRRKLWLHIVRILLENNIVDNEVIRLLTLRFFYGNSWDDCSKEMMERYPLGKWNLNKCFRVYRAVLSRIDKKSV